MQKTTLANKATIARNWVVVDLKDKILGRAATKIANILRGKTKAIYTPHEDTGDFVIAINAAQVRLTGNKWKQKKYYHHSGYQGGIKEFTAEKLLARDPRRLIQRAVHGMLPKNKTNEHLMKKLRVYAGAEHPHQAQQPKQVEV
ncbi:MAG: 50S ribosomal protein L13 [Deltaproteobacteria bacterium]|nr:50S ribosomal protein L13 [Deltaproteobacteria bacterium]